MVIHFSILGFHLFSLCKASCNSREADQGMTPVEGLWLKLALGLPMQSCPDVSSMLLGLSCGGL